jgi:hypothetical protein
MASFTRTMTCMHAHGSHLTEYEMPGEWHSPDVDFVAELCVPRPIVEQVFPNVLFSSSANSAAIKVDENCMIRYDAAKETFLIQGASMADVRLGRAFIEGELQKHDINLVQPQPTDHFWPSTPVARAPQSVPSQASTNAAGKRTRCTAAPVSSANPVLRPAGARYTHTTTGVAGVTGTAGATASTGQPRAGPRLIQRQGIVEDGAMEFGQEPGEGMIRGEPAGGTYVWVEQGGQRVLMRVGIQGDESSSEDDLSEEMLIAEELERLGVGGGGETGTQPRRTPGVVSPRDDGYAGVGIAQADLVKELGQMQVYVCGGGRGCVREGAGW